MTLAIETNFRYPGNKCIEITPEHIGSNSVQGLKVKFGVQRTYS